MKPHHIVYTDAVPKWLNHAGERVFQIFMEYRNDDDKVIGTGWTMLTSNGSDKVHV